MWMTFQCDIVHEAIFALEEYCSITVIAFKYTIMIINYEK